MKLTRAFLTHGAFVVTLFSISIYYIGFLFVQGLVSPFTNTFILDIKHVIPFTYQTYIINGLRFSVVYLCLPLFTSLMFYLLLLYIEKTSLAKSLKSKFLGIKLLSKHKSFQDKSILWALVYLLFLLIIIFLTYFPRFYDNILSSIHFFFYNTILLVILAFIFYLCNYIMKDSKAIDDKSILANRSNSVTLIIVVFISMVLISMSISFQGLLMQTAIIDRLANNNGDILIAKVELESDEILDLLSIEVGNDFFVGYSINEQTLTIIPNNSIKTINTYSMMTSKSMKHIDTTDPLFNLISSYYQYRITEPNPELLKKLIYPSDTLKRFYLTPNSVIETRWEKNNTLNEMPVQEFLSFIKISQPEINEENNEIKVSVIEYWESKDNYVVYTIENELITNIQYQLQPFIIE